MKILIATGIYPPDIGGPATYSKILNDALPAKGIDVEVYSFGEVKTLPKIMRHISYFFGVLKRGKEVDIIYAQDPVSVGLPALLAAKILKKKFVLKIVGDYAWEQGVQRSGITDLLDDFAKKKKGYPFLVRILKYVQAYVAHHADSIVTPSNYLKKIISYWGVSPEKITVINNAFVPTAYRESREDTKEKLSLHGKNILSVGRLVPWKGFSVIVHAMASIVREFPDTTLFIAGSGPDEENIKKVIENSRMKDNVVLLGKLPKEELLQYVRAVDVFALNTSYEGFSHQILEVMAEGTPVITTNVGGNPELVDNGVDGVLIAYNDREAFTREILDIFRKKRDISTMTARAKEKAYSFSKERMVNAISEKLLSI